MTTVTTPGVLRRMSDMNLTLADPREDIRGRRVFDAQDQETGEIDDLLIDESERKIRFLRIASGGFLGLGQKTFLVPIDAIERVEPDRVRLRATREHVAAAPAYDPELVDTSYYDNIYKYYGYSPYWHRGYVYPMWPY